MTEPSNKSKYDSPALDALQRELDKTVAERDARLAECQAFEARYGIDSDSFIAAWHKGEMGDESAHFNWFSAKRALDIANLRIAFMQPTLEDNTSPRRYANPDDDPNSYTTRM